MIIDQDQQEKVIDLLMRYFDAMSTNSKDFSSSDLLQFHITLLPGTHPVWATALIPCKKGRLPAGFSVAYLDGIWTYSNNVSNHMHHPGEFLRIQAEAETKVNLSECKILKPQVTNLGHLVSYQRVEMIPECTFLRSIFGLLL